MQRYINVERFVLSDTIFWWDIAFVVDKFLSFIIILVNGCDDEELVLHCYNWKYQFLMVGKRNQTPILPLSIKKAV